MEATALLLLLLIPGTLGGPVSWTNTDRTFGTSTSINRCGTSYCTGWGKLRYDIDKTYKYNYEVSTVTSMHGASEDVSSMDIKATVNIHVISKCELALTLTDVVIMRSNPNMPSMEKVDDWEFKSALERNNLRFSFQNGRIDDLCPEENENTMSLNFKRGVLSALQNSMEQHERDESLLEVDVTGTCPTEYKVAQKGWKSSQFNKVKDLLGCTDRHDYRTSLQSTPFRVPDAIQSLPLLKGNHRCTQTVSSEGHVLSASCIESLVFRPFSKKEAGARTETTQKITHTNTVSGASFWEVPISSRTNLLFQHKQTKGSDDQTLWAAREKLSELCRITVHDIPAEVPGFFTDLVYLMRGLDDQQIRDIAERLERGNICEENKKKARKFYLDALPMVGTSSSVNVMVDMLLATEVTDTEANLWISSLHFVQHPTEEMIVQLKRLLLSEKYRMPSLLPVSTLVNNFCHGNGNCLRNRKVGDLVDVLNDILGQNCQSGEQDLVLMALRAVGNLGYSDSMVPTLERCMESSFNSDNIRVMAAQAFRGVTCDADREALMETFMNKGVDSELRISAYLGVMQCANEVALNKVREALKAEEVNQVGSFVWTHLTNLLETSNPHKQAIKSILDDEELQKEFNMDRRKFSRNYEVSFFSDKFGTGATGESNVIWSSKSFLPRSAMVNLTVDMLGHSVNLLEVGGRMQGLEQLLQNYMGSGGIFKGGEKSKPGAPSRCVKQQKMDNMKDKFAVEKDELTASMYLRVFGNELGYHHFNEKELTSMKEKFKVKDILATLAKGHDISFTQSAMFMDSSISVPTIAGMVLTLSVNGTASVELNAEGKMDLRKASLKRLEAKFNVRPSGAVQLSGMMSLDAGVTRTGLKMVTTLHTSTAVSGSLDLTNGQVLSIDFDTPKENLEVLDVKSEFFIIHNQLEKRQEMITENKMTKLSCSSDKVLKVMGYELCGAMSFVTASENVNAPYFPFAGPLTASVTLHKKDAPKGFKLIGKQIQNKATSIAHLSVDTPGSSQDRAISLGYFIDRQAKTAEIELNSPWKRLLAKGSYTIEKKSRVLSATVLDDGREHKLLMRVDQENKKGKTIWTPALEISRPEDSKVLAAAPEKLEVGGTVAIDDKYQEIEADISIKSGLKPDPIMLRGNFINKEKQHTIAGSVTLNKKESYSATFQLLKTIVNRKLMSGKLEPTILISTPEYQPFLLSSTIDFKEEKLVRGNVQIKMEKTLKEPITLNFKITKQNKKTSSRYRGQGKLTSQFAKMKSNGFVLVPSGPGKFKGPLLTAKVSMDYSLPILRDKSSRKNKIMLGSKVHDRSSKSLKKYDVNVNFESKYSPENNFIADAEMSHKNSFTKASLTLRQGAKAKYVKDKTREMKVGMSVSHKIDDKNADIRYDIQMLYPLKGIEYQIQGKHEHHLKNRFSFETYNSVVYAKGKNVEFRLLGSDNSKKDNLDASGTLEISFPTFSIGNKMVEARMYKIGTSIMKNVNKEYIHTVNVQINEGAKHSLVTKFKKSKNAQFDLYSELQINGNHPSKLTLQAVRKAEKFLGSLEFLKNGYTYSAELSSESVNKKYYINSWDILWPERRVKGSLEGGNKKNGEHAVTFFTLWDADRDTSKRIDIEISSHAIMRKEYQKYDYLFSVTTPFQNHKIYSYKRLMEVSSKEVKDEFQLIYNKRENEISYTLWLALPVKLEKFEMKSTIVTPTEAVRKAGLDIIHKFDGSRYLSSSAKGVLNDNDMSVALLVANTGDAVRNDLEGVVTLTSSHPKLRNILLKFKHNDDGRVYTTEGQYERNGKQYKVVLEATYFRIHYQAQIDSKLEIYFPSDRPMTIKWIHSNTLTNLNSTISLNWKTEYDSKLIIGAKFNKAEKDHALDIFVTTPWKEISTFEYQVRLNQMNGISGSTFYVINRDPRKTYRTTYKYTDTEVQIEASDARSNTKVDIKFKHFPYTISLQYTWYDKGEHKILIDGSVSENMQDGWTADAKLLSPWKPFDNVDLRGNVRKMSQSEWMFDSVISLGVRERITANFSVDIDNWTKMSGLIKTPYDKMKLMDFGFSRKHTDNMYSSESYLEMQPIFNMVKLEQTMTLKPDFSTRYHIDLPDTEIKYLEINVDGKKQRRGYSSHVKVNYYPGKEIDLAFKGRYNKNKFPENTKVALDFATPFEALPTLNVKLDIDKENEKWQGLFDLKSSAEILKYLNVKMDQESTETSCYSDFEISSSVFEDVAAGMHFDWGDLAGANLTLNAPSVGKSMIGFKKKSKSWTDFQNKVFAEINGFDLDMDIGLKHEEKLTKAWLVYAYPGADHSNIKMSIHRIGNSPHDFDVGSFLQVGKNSRPYNISMQYSFVQDKMALGTTLETPYTKSLSYLIRQQRTADGSNTLVYGKYGRKYLIDSYLSNELTDSTFHQVNKHEYLFDGKGHKSNVIIDAKWSDMGQEALIHTTMDDRWAKATMNRIATSTGAERGTQVIDVMFYSPMKDFTDFGLHVEAHKQPNGHHGKCNFEYMDKKEAVLTYDLSQKNKNLMALTATLTTPVEGYETNTLTYNQLSKRDKFSADLETVTGRGERMTGKLEFKNKEEFVLTLKGPLEKFDSMTVSGTFNEKQQRVNGKASLFLTMNSRPANLDFDIHINKQPVTLIFNLKSPYENFRDVKLTVDHEGQDWKEFKTISKLNSEKLGFVNTETSWKFNSIHDMGGSGKLTSSVENMENLKLGFSTKESRDVHTSHLEIGWEADKEIKIENVWNLNDLGPKTSFTTSLGVTTPFNDLKNGNLKLTHTHGPEIFTESIAVQHNGRTYVDADLDYQYGNRHKGNVEVRSPRPMSFFVTGSANKETFEGQVKMNWDKRSPEANIELISSLSDRSESLNVDKEFKFKVIHPVRIMGMDCTYKKANNEILSSGQVTWDEQNGNTFLYDFGFLDRSSRYSEMFEGHVKLGVPHRSIKLKGSYSDTGTSLTTSSEVLWDADRDEKKKVTMATTVENKPNMKRIGLNINLPHINKQMNLGASTKGGYGSTIVDSKAEITYSSDPRKMITVTSVITNSEISSDKNYNYTMEFGFKHPITETDMQFTSHVGSVEKVCSFGSQFIFLTTSKEKKSLALWGMLDRAKKNMQVKVFTPLKNVEVEGTVENFSKRHIVRLTSFEDGKQALTLYVLMDERRRKTNVEFNYDQSDASKSIMLSSQYVNDSSILVNLISKDGSAETSESMIAVNLNTSHVLHTRILWRPTLLRELQTFMGAKVTAFSYAANEAFNKAVDSVGSEVKAKYLLVSRELTSEMSQVFQLMEKEMDRFSSQLQTLRTEFRRFYQRNDLHIRDMGEQVKAAFDEMFVQIRHAVRNYQSYYNSITRATNEWMADLKTYPVAQQYSEAVQELVTGLRNLREVLEETLNEVVVEVEKFSEVSYKKYLEISRAMDRKLNSYTRTLHDLPLYRKMMAQRARFERMGSENVPGWEHIYDAAYLKTQQLLQDQFHDMMVRPEFGYIHSMASEIHQQIKYWNTEQTLNMGVRRIVDLSKNLILMELVKLKNSLLALENSRVTVYDPERGEIQFEIYMPVPLTSLDKPPEIKIGKYLKYLKQWTHTDVSVSPSDMWDTYYEYVPSLEPSSWVPPFEASAYLIGGQHYITFDETQFDFLSTCSHVLTRDMLNDSFSVVVNYEKRARQNGVESLCFNIEDSLSFEISSSYKLKVNGRDIEMPFITDKVKVVREGDFIRMEYIGGLQVLCNPKLDIYKVTVEGWHHGHLAGMLGKYDNEPSNDVITAQKSDDLEVNRRSCNSRNISLVPNPSSDKNSMCSSLFGDNASKFRPCFKQVDPSSFVHLCQVYMSRMSENDAIHKVTEQYRYVCQGQGVYIGPLKDYIPCNSKETFTLDDKDPIYQSADVLFVLEDTKCNKWAASSLSAMVTEVNNALMNKGMKENRFGLESYGGADSEDVSVRTINGQSFGQASMFLRAVETLRFMESDGTGDIASALKMAMKYPYRPGVAKVLIIAPCSACEVSILEGNMASVLKSEGFSVHILQEQGLTAMTNDNSPQKVKIYGLDDTKTFSNQVLDSELTVEQVQKTKSSDYCEKMAHATSGSVFDTIHLHDNNRVQREFIKAFAHRVGWDTKLPPCQICNCNPDSGRVECKLCNTNTIFTYLPMRPPSLPEVVGTFHDLNHDVQKYFGYAK